MQQSEGDLSKSSEHLRIFAIVEEENFVEKIHPHIFVDNY